jgi:hypothetical protein
MNRRNKRTNEWTEKRDITLRKYERNPENIPYFESEKIYRRINIKDRHKERFDEDGEVIHSRNDYFQQPSDEDAQEIVLTEEERALITMNDSHRTPNKEDTKPAAKPEDQESPPSPEPNRKRLWKQEHKTDQMKKLFSTFTENTHTQKLWEQGEKYKMEITAMKWANMDKHNLLTTKTTPTQTMNDHRKAAHFIVMTKPYETLFNGTPENWPAFEHHLLTEAETPPSYGTRKSKTSNHRTEHQNSSNSSKDTLISLKTWQAP